MQHETQTTPSALGHGRVVVVYLEAGMLRRDRGGGRTIGTSRHDAPSREHLEEGRRACTGRQPKRSSCPNKASLPRGDTLTVHPDLVN